MQCPKCNFTEDFLVKCKHCPQCTFLLQHGHNIPTREHGGAPSTAADESDTSTGNKDLAERNGQSRGENQQQDASDAETEQPKSSSSQQHGHIQPPNKYHGTSPVQQEEAVTEERAGSGQGLKWTVTTFHFGNEDAVSSEAASATNTTRRASENERNSSDTGLPSAHPPLDGHGEPIKNMDVSGNDTQSEARASASSAAIDILKDAGTARDPAGAEGSEVAHVSKTKNMFSVEENTISANSSEYCHPILDERKQQLGREDVVEDRNIIETFETSAKPKDGERNTPSSSEVASGPVTRQTAERETQSQSNVPSSSDTGSKLEPVIDHPLSGPGNDDNGKLYKETNENEGWDSNIKEKKGRSIAVKQTSRIQPGLQQVTPEAGVTVVFHVLLATNLQMTESSLFIRAKDHDLGEWRYNCVDMGVVETDKSKDKDKLMLFHGQFTITLDLARHGTPYGYIVVKDGVVFWEKLLDFPPWHRQENNVHRVLKIPENCIGPGALWHQFDGVAYVSDDKSNFMDTVVELFSKDKRALYRSKALRRFLPKWRGFLVNEGTEKFTATEALVELQHVVKCLSKGWVVETETKPSEREPAYFEPRKALMDILEPKMKQNIATTAKVNGGSPDHVSAVLSSLAVMVLVENNAIELKPKQNIAWLSCLALKADPSDKRCLAFEKVLAEFSPALRKIAASCIERLCNELMTEGKNKWIFAIPLLHFLRGDSKPFEEPEIRGDPNSSDWWGANNLKIIQFKRNPNQRDFADECSSLASAFEVDRLLKRTFLYAIPIWHLHKIVPKGVFHVSDVCVALITLLPGVLAKYSKVLTQMIKDNSLQKCVQAMINMLETGNERSRWSETEIAEFTVVSSLKLLKWFLESYRYEDSIELICCTMKLLLLSLQECQNFSGCPADDISKRQQGVFLKKDCICFKELVRRLDGETGCKMSDDCKSKDLTRELEGWSKLLNVTEGTQGFEEYRRYLTKQFICRARTVGDICLVKFFCKLDLKIYDRAVEESIRELAFEAVENIIMSQQVKDTDCAFTMMQDAASQGVPGAAKYGALLSKLLSKSWPNTSHTQSRSGLDLSTVKFLLTWNLMARYFRSYGAESGRGNILTAEGQETLSMAKSILTDLEESISNATITVETLELLQKYKENFLELLKMNSSIAKKEARAHPKMAIERSLAKRIQELEEFKAVRAKVAFFVSMCSLIKPVNITDIEERSKACFSSCQILQLCYKEVEVKFFALPLKMKQVLSQLDDVRKSSSFQRLWTQYGKNAQTARENDEPNKLHLEISDVIVNVWTPAFNNWNNHVSTVVDGTMTLKDVDELFDSYKDRKKELKQELTVMFQYYQSQTGTDSPMKLQPLVDERVTQIQRYQNLYQCADAAGTIWEFKEAMGFSGDFAVIEDYLRLCSKGKKLDDFKQKPLNSIGERFSKAGRALDCLDVNKRKCFKAVMDSKRLVYWLRSTVKSTQELKVLVDLALISAGEGDMETDRISCLHTSCLGFAPLIFDLQESEEQKVGFDELMKVCNPVWKALETNLKLPEKLYDTSRHLEWLKAVRETHGSVAVTSLTQTKTINSSGVYVVGNLDTKNGPSEQGKRLSFKDVIQLKVPPKDGSEENQTKTYSIDELKDLQSKLMLIAGKAEKGKVDVETFVRNLEGVMRLATAYINLFESGFVHRMNWNKEFACRKDQFEGELVAKEMAVASTSMETCYVNWKKKVSDARKKYTELNFFTTQQLTVLRKEIAAVCQSDDLLISNIQVLTLLESVRPNLTSEHLKSAIKRAFKGTYLLKKAKGTAYLPSLSQVPSPGGMVTRSPKETESNKLHKLSPKLPETIVDHGRRKEDDNEMEISQYLTLAQLGSILRELPVKGKVMSIHTCPEFLKRGRPNFMFVPKDDILPTVLALYMHDRQQSLPSHEEVLICTPETTTEEIELLWRRATGDLEGRFYCLVHADLLGFSVSKQALDMLSVVTQGLAGKTGEHYGLVVICSSESEERSHVFAALNQYRVDTPPCPSPEDLKIYLKHQFQAPFVKYGWISNSTFTWTAAGSLDPEKLCVRVVSSQRGGMGKTLFVRRLTEQLPKLENNNIVLTNLRRQNYNPVLNVTVPLHGDCTDSSTLVDALLPHAAKADVPLSRIFHLDVSPLMRSGLDTLLFNLLVLGFLCDKMGRVWRRRSTDLYVIEITTASPLLIGLTREEAAESQGRQSRRSAMFNRPFYDLLPTILCDTPSTVLFRLADNPDTRGCNPLFDIKEFQHPSFQRVYQYLKLFREGKSLDNFTFSLENIDDDRKTCLDLLLSNCGIPDPSWSEIRHFVSFLNSQLRDCEQSVYCDMQLMRTVLAGPNVLNLEGFRSFVVRFMIQMSRVRWLNKVIPTSFHQSL